MLWVSIIVFQLFYSILQPKRALSQSRRKNVKYNCYISYINIYVYIFVFKIAHCFSKKWIFMPLFRERNKSMQIQLCVHAASEYTDLFLSTLYRFTFAYIWWSITELYAYLVNRHLESAKFKTARSEYLMVNKQYVERELFFTKKTWSPFHSQLHNMHKLSKLRKPFLFILCCAVIFHSLSVVFLVYAGLQCSGYWSNWN